MRGGFLAAQKQGVITAIGRPKAGLEAVAFDMARCELQFAVEVPRLAVLELLRCLVKVVLERCYLHLVCCPCFLGDGMQLRLCQVLLPLAEELVHRLFELDEDSVQGQEVGVDAARLGNCSGHLFRSSRLLEKKNVSLATC